MINKYTKQTATAEAIRLAKGKYIKPGDVVATEDEPRTWQLDRLAGDTAFLSIHDEHRIVKTEDLFNVKQVINIANHLLNLGFWAEGLKSTVIQIQK